MNTYKFELEVGARTLDDVYAAASGGADRVELYSSPMEGALTPSAGLIKTAAEAGLNIRLFAMIRPRAGDFLYSDREFQTMIRDVETAVENGADGVMCGILKQNGDLDVERMRELRERCGERLFTLHRAFDFTRDPKKTLEEAVDLGCDYVLTLGQRADATFPRRTLREIIAEAEGRVKIMLGYGADFDTADLADEVKDTGARVFHIVNGYRTRKSRMNSIPASTGNDDHLKETMFNVEYLDADEVRRCREILDACCNSGTSSTTNLH